MKSVQTIESLSFAGWNMLGALAGVLKNYGVNILLNIFYGPLVNAARAIAYQVMAASLSFVATFSSAYKPVMFKKYAKGEVHDFILMISSCSKISFVLLLGLTLPLLFYNEVILALWLGDDVPDQTPCFVTLVVVDVLFEALNHPISVCVQAYPCCSQ